MNVQRSDPSQPQAPGGAARTQVGALCWRMNEGKLQVLLVTSRDTGRWVLPKGWPKRGKSAADSAGAEAWEEAGVQGAVREVCVGVYTYVKTLGPEGGVPCAVAVYPLKVKALARSFPERAQRTRHWFSPKKAAQKVDEPELRELMLSFDPRTLKD